MDKGLERLKKEILEDLSKIKGMILHEPKPASNKISEWYVDVKRSYGEQGFLHKYAIYILSSIGLDIQNFSCIVGSGHGGISLATEIFSRLEMYDIKLSLIRNSPKNHGKPTMFDGYPIEELSKNKKILIVDDVFTTGGSIKKIINLLQEDQKFEIFVVYNRLGIERPEVNGVEVKYIISSKELTGKGPCGECLGGGCSPPQQPDCLANSPNFPANTLELYKRLSDGSHERNG